MQSDELVLGIDGGGSKTVAWLALCSPSGEPPVIGRGMAGAANPQAVGFAKAIENLDRAIAAAFDNAQTQSAPVAAAVLALAGSDRDENRQVFQQWAKQRNLAHRFRVVHDALPVLMAGSPEGWGVALISGTGSLAFGQSRDGRSARAGGWGFLLGDEGSGYAIARAGLRAAAKSADGRGPATQLLAALLDRLKLRESHELVPAVYKIAADPAAIASLADVVTRTAGEGDIIAQSILDEAAGDLATLVAAAAKKLGFSLAPFPLVLTGGVLLGSEDLRCRLEAHIGSLRLRPEPVATVPDPVAGAARLAQSLASGVRS